MGRKGFKGFIVNQTLSSLHGRTLEITLTVPLNNLNITHLFRLFMKTERYLFINISSP